MSDHDRHVMICLWRRHQTGTGCEGCRGRMLAVTRDQSNTGGPLLGLESLNRTVNRYYRVDTSYENLSSVESPHQYYQLNSF